MNERAGVATWTGIACLLIGCAEPDVEQAPVAMSGMRFLGDTAAQGFAQALEPRPFVFPEDHGSHDQYRAEWWYFTGNLESADARHFGFELTFFRYAIAASSEPRASAWATRQIWMAHLALTDTQRRRFDATERLSRGALDLAGARADRFAVWVEDWTAAQSDTSAPIRLTASSNGFGIDLWLEPRKRIVLHGEDGLDRKGPEVGNASYYYSWPRLEVRGHVQPVAEQRVAVTGLAWLDREWSTSALSPGIVGWDWFALQLADGRDLMFYRLRDEAGEASAWSGGSIVAVDGATRRLSAESVRLDVEDTWTSPNTGVTYPIAWRLHAAAHDLDLSIRPVLVDQEIDLSVRYWEGAVAIESADPGRSISGNGYLELAGYEAD